MLDQGNKVVFGFVVKYNGILLIHFLSWSLMLSF
jgi:hypothetical protein